MIELRYVNRLTEFYLSGTRCLKKVPVLQYRESDAPLEDFVPMGVVRHWSEWKDVPVVEAE